jgi:RimJ/RimL family protein N-acetyltransferase
VTDAVPEEIVTDRLRIRPFRAEDLHALAEIFAKPEVWKFPFRRGLTAEETERFLEGRIERQARPGTSAGVAEDRSSGRLIGYIHLTPPDWLPEVMPAVEIGWRLDPECWGKGLATEGARAVLAHGFTTMELPEILSIFEPENTASGRVMERIGMEPDHDTRHPYFDVPLRIYRLSREEWLARSHGP